MHNQPAGQGVGAGAVAVFRVTEAGEGDAELVPAVVAVARVPIAREAGIVLHGAMPLVGALREPTAAVHLVDEPEVELGVVDDDDSLAQHIEQGRVDIRPAWGVGYHPVVDAVDADHVVWDDAVGPDKRVEECPTVAVNDGDLDDLGPAIDAGRLGVEVDDIRAGDNLGCPGNRGGARPATVTGARRGRTERIGRHHGGMALWVRFGGGLIRAPCIDDSRVRRHVNRASGRTPIVIGTLLVDGIASIRLARLTLRATLLIPFVTIVLAALLAATFPPLARDAAARSLSWERYDVTLDVHEDGSFTVTEDQVIAFVGGSFSEGYAVIPLSRVEDIRNIQVFEDGQPYRRGYGSPGEYDVSVAGGEVQILWWFEPASDERRNFTISYDVIGGLRVYQAEDGTAREQLWWRAVDEEFAANIQTATVTVNLPQPVSQDQLSLAWYAESDAEVTYEVQSPTTAFFEATGIEQGDALEARLEFPKMTAAAVPSWQAADDERRAQEERLAPYKALANVIMLAVGLLLLVGGIVGVIVLWFTKGRDAPVALPIDLLREPPDDLPAGVVGTLIDERAHDHDVIAALVALGERGVIQIEERQKGGMLGVLGLSGRDFVFRRVEHNQELAKHEEELLEAIFGSKTTGEVQLSNIKERFAAQQAQVKEALYDELVSRGYFPRNPQSVRRVYRGLGLGLLGLSIFGGFFLFAAIGTFAPLVIVPLIAAVVVGVILIGVGGAMPRKTQAGAEAAAKWLAFRRYLDEIERYDNVEEAKAIFNRYLPYAVAFGLERSWVNKFASVDAPAPSWYGPYGEMGYPRGRTTRTGRYPRGGRGPVIIPGGIPGGGAGGDFDMPDLQDMSDAAGGGLQGMSDGLFDLFNEASQAFTAYNSSGRRGGGSFRSGGFGGFSGGGGGFGGGGGGGGRGFR